MAPTEQSEPVTANPMTASPAGRERTSVAVDGAGARVRALSLAAAGIVSATTEDELLAVAHHHLARVLPVDAVALGRYDAAADTLHFLGDLDGGVPVDPISVPVEGTPAESVIRERRSLLTLSSRDPRAAGSTVVGTGRRSESVIRCPLVADGEVLGLISIQCYQRNAYDDADVGTVEIVAATVAAALLNLRIRAELAEKAEQERDARTALARSEERHRALLEHSHDLIAVVNPDGVLTYVSPSSQQVLGATPAELVGRHVEELLAEHEVERARSVFRDQLEGRKPRHVPPFEFRHADGGTRSIELVGSNLLQHPSVRGFVYNGRDVTDRRRAEERGAATLRRLRAAQSVARVGDWEYDLVEDRVTWSEELHRIYGVPTGEELTYTSFAELIHPDDRPSVEATIQQAFDEGSSYEIDHRIVRPDGIVRHVHGRGIYEADPDGVPIRAFGTSQDVTELRETEAALRSAQKRMRVFLDQMPAILWMTDTELRFTWSHGAGLASLGEAPTKAVGLTIEEYFETDDPTFPPIDGHRRALEGERVSYELEWEGGTFETHLEPLHGEDGTIVGTLGFALDVTERKSLEQRLREAQRMEAIGRLAGGVAHDFNNILTVIDGHADLLLDQVEECHSARSELVEMQKAARRAAALTRQLLAFSRRQVLVPRVVDLNRAVTELERMLQRLIGEDIRLRTELDPDIGVVEVDPAQLEQVLMNLAVNARDAMDDGGTLTIRTRNDRIDGHRAETFPYPVRPGEYVRLDVVDTGRGMEPRVAEQAFEPFFTTKPDGEGTGLGLATVYGIVKQSGGYVWVHSAPDAGTRVEILLPRIEGRHEAPPDAVEEPADGGTETILLVEDEDPVRALTHRVLERKGYRVVAARNGLEALAVCAELDATPDLVLTDVVMPKLSGTRLVERLRGTAPGIRALYMSGYTEDEVLRRGIVQDEVAFLQKPFTPASLARKVREVLDEPSPVGNAPADR